MSEIKRYKPDEEGKIAIEIPLRKRGKVSIEIDPNYNLETKIKLEYIEGIWNKFNKEQQKLTMCIGVFYRLNKFKILEDGSKKSYYTFYRILNTGLVKVEPHVVKNDGKTGLASDETPRPPIKEEHSEIYYFALGDPKPKEGNPNLYILRLARISIYPSDEQTVLQAPPHNH